MRSIGAEKNKRIRAAVLEILKTQYPGALDLKVLRFTLDNLGFPMTESSLSAHLKYLQEKGLLRAETKKGAGFRLVYASLTAKGWDLLDGNIAETGVDESL